MGYMKQLSIQISREVYEMKLTDEAIIENIQRAYPKTPAEWIQKQINTVRNNPKIYKERIH